MAGSIGSLGFGFFCFCSACLIFGVSGRVRGSGRNKWVGVQDMRIERPPRGGPSDRGYFPTSSGMFGNLLERDSVREQLLR